MKYDPYSRHEVLHMASVVSDLFDRHFLQHRYVNDHPGLREKADAIAKALADFQKAVDDSGLDD